MNGDVKPPIRQQCTMEWHGSTVSCLLFAFTTLSTETLTDVLFFTNSFHRHVCCRLQECGGESPETTQHRTSEGQAKDLQGGLLLLYRTMGNDKYLDGKTNDMIFVVYLFFTIVSSPLAFVIVV